MSALSSKITAFFSKSATQTVLQDSQPAPEQVAEVSNNVISFDAEQIKPIPRYLQLARSIHTRISAEEEKELAVYRAAEAQAARKNEVIMRAVQEVVDFCALLRNAPDLNKMLEQKAVEITERLYSNRSTYTIQHEPISVHYEAPLYQVDMHAPDHIRLTGCNNSHIQIGFNPVKFVMTDKFTTESSTVTQYLMSRQYRIESDGTFQRQTGDDGQVADPIAEILTDLRLKLGFEFFEKTLLPFLESETSKTTGI
jgi:hypothetical protein